MSPDEFDQILHDTEVKLARLRALYEQYFQGIEKMEPHVARKDMERALDTLRRNLPRNTALRFRMQQLAARYGTYLTYWQRIGRQIEEGTYRRDVMRAKRKVSPHHHRADEAAAWEIDVDVDAIEESDFGSAFDESDVDAILGALKPMSLAPKKPDAPKKDDGAGWSPAPPSTEVPAAARSIAPRTGLSAFGGFGARPQSRGLSVAGPLPTAKPTLPPVTKPAVPPPSTGVRPAVSTPVVPAAVAAPAVMARAAGAPAVARPAAPPAPAPRPAPSSAVVSGGGVDGNAMRALYDRYADARRKNNEGAVRFETLHESVQRMVPKLREKYGDRKVDFEVVVQNGRVGLKPKATE